MDRPLNSLAFVTPRLTTASQPSAAAIPALRAEGFDHVINLGLSGQPYSLYDEQSLVLSHGMAYTHIPVPFESPQPAHFAAFLEAMDAAAGAKVFLHCAANYRATVFAALYGVRRLGWDRARAEDHIAPIWRPNPAWRAFLDSLYAPARSASDLDGRVFRPVSNTPNGEVASETRFRYREEAGRIWGEYAGGAILRGRLAGRRLSDTEFLFSYRHRNRAGEERTGECRSFIAIGTGGCMRIREKWRWTCGDRSEGESEIEEVRA